MTARSFSNKESYIWKKQGIYLIRKFPKSRGKEADMEKTEGMEEKNRSFGRGVLYGAVGALVVVALLYEVAVTIFPVKCQQRFAVLLCGHGDLFQ